MHSTYDEIQEILDDYKQELPEVEPEWPYKVQSAYVFIYEHLFDPRLTVGCLRKQCRINQKSFSAQFKLCTGFGPKQYILHHRIEASKQLLTHPEANITEIALAVGFGSVSAFCNAFKIKENTRPTRWKEMIQN